ncbi:MAG: hybrid sensor histidine kinase/response regulator, partial [Zetaproteobacteria bacterium]
MIPAANLTRDQLQYLRDNLPPSMFAVLAGIGALLFVFHGHVSKTLLGGCAAITLGALAFRAWVFLALRKNMDDTAKAARLVLASAAATGLAWGVASIALASHTHDPMLWVFLAFFLSGYASGAVFSTSAWLPACAAYFFPTIVPITIWFFIADMPNGPVMGLLLIVFTYAAWNMARNAHRFLIERIEKQLMVTRLQQEAHAQESKTHALQTMAGGIAHEYNNLFTAMLGSIHLLRISSDTKRTARLLDLLEDSVKRGAR